MRPSDCGNRCETETEAVWLTETGTGRGTETVSVKRTEIGTGVASRSGTGSVSGREYVMMSDVNGLTRHSEVDLHRGTTWHGHQQAGPAAAAAAPAGREELIVNGSRSYDDDLGCSTSGEVGGACVPR